jgi:hypothetical protein
MLKIIFLSFLVFLVSCGGGGSSVALNSQPETITFKTVPDNIGIFD